jgi:hypothetical protein
MAGQWKEVAKLRFKGDRFRDHALDLSAVTELRQFQRMVAETAKALWRAANPDRKNLPAHFEDRTRLCLRRIEDGSATAPLEVYLEKPDQSGLWEPEPTEVNEAIRLAHKVFECASEDRPLPEQLPKELVEDYVNWGRSLGDNEEIELQPSGAQRPARVNTHTRQRLTRFIERPHPSTIEVVGELFEADVRQQRSQVWLDTNTAVGLMFDAAQEDTITTALKNHRSVRIRVRGFAEVAPDGRPLRFTRVDSLELVDQRAWEFDPNAPSIEDQITEIWRDLPQEERDRVPTDLSDYLDHYIYGTPKE